MSTLVPPQVLVDTPRPQKDGDKSDITIALNNFANCRPKSPRSPRSKHCGLHATKTITRAKSPVPPSK